MNEAEHTVSCTHYRIPPSCGFRDWNFISISFAKLPWPGETEEMLRSVV